MDKKKVVVSLGHSALGYTTLEQWEAVKTTTASLASLVEENYQLVITHSNGPQVSMIHKAMTELRRIYSDYTPVPMSVCSAMSQGYIGYDIQNNLRAELYKKSISKNVCTIITQVVVDPYDEAFYEPHKIIGRSMNSDEASSEINKGNYVKELDDNTFKRVVAAPKPLKIVEIDSIRTLLDNDQIVIACGGGGIPVMEQGPVLKGASAVIEKDAIASVLASDLNADQLIILTDVDFVYKNYKKENETRLKNITVSEAKEYISGNEFGDGTMLPKIEAAINYLSSKPNGSVLITSISNLSDALKGKSGTVITA